MQDECRRYLEVGLDNLHKDVKRAEEGEVQGPMDGMRMSAATVAAEYELRYQSDVPTLFQSLFFHALMIAYSMP